MLALFRNNNPFTVIILLILAILLKLKMLLHPQLAPAYPPDFFFNFITYLLNAVFHKNAAAFTFFTVLLIFLQAIYFNFICNRRKLFTRSTYIPAFAYLLLSSVYAGWNFFTPALLINWCVLGAFDIILTLSQSNHPRKHIFNAGFLLAMPALLHFSALLFIFILIVSLLMLRSFHLAEWVVALLGFLTPFYFLVSILYLADYLSLLPNWIHLAAAKNAYFSLNANIILLIIGFLVIISCGLYATNVQMPKSSIYNRRNWGVIVISFIITLMVAFLSGFTIPGAWFMLIPFISFLTAMALNNEKTKGFSNFVFYFTLLFIIFSQLAIN